MKQSSLDQLFNEPPFGMRQAEKEEILLSLLNEQTRIHREHCSSYAKITSLSSPLLDKATSLSEVPYLPLQIFKLRRLRSFQQDSDISRLATRALSLLIGSVTDNLKLPLLIIDHESSLRGHGAMGTRATAIQSLMPYGRNVCFALDEDFKVDHDRVRAFLEKYAGTKFLVFGFTYLIWKYFVPYCEQHNEDFSNGVLLHTGGWKKMQELAVDNITFKIALKKVSGLSQIMNFYSMPETPGTLLIENNDGLLYPPCFADIIIRDPITLAPLPKGQMGIIEIVSAIPNMQPTHALLTEDTGIIENIDAGSNGFYGKGIRILGRLPRIEIRGCSEALSGMREKTA